MNRDSNKSIIPKIILILGTLSVLGIILLFFRPKFAYVGRQSAPEAPEELFTQVIAASSAEILKLWEEGDRFIKSENLNCPEEIIFDKSVGRNYYQCQPHFWQCYWQGGVEEDPTIKIELYGETYHVRARASFDPILDFSTYPRHYEMFSRKDSQNDLGLNYGYIVELEVIELPGLSQPLILSDTCRDVYLPERVYGYGQKGPTWDNFGKKIFIDKFYVSNQQVNAWRLQSGQKEKIIKDRKLWAHPALLSLDEQKAYCSFYGKRLLEAKLFDAATMTPVDLKNLRPEKVLRPKTPWQRDLSKTFLGVSRINPDYQLTPLDCQLAQVKGCKEKHFTTDSVSWMGVNYALGFYPESFDNPVEPEKNLKLSSVFLPPDSEWHELGLRSTWNGIQENLPVAFRCFEEVAK